MVCPNQLEDGRACGDEGELCDSCGAEERRDHEYLRNVSKYAAGFPLDDDYYAQLRDAGRIP